MGEHAEEYMRQEMIELYGFDLADCTLVPNHPAHKKQNKQTTKYMFKDQCPKCKKWVKGLDDHMRDVHKIPKATRHD